MGIKLFRKLRRKQSSNSLKKTVEKIDNEIVTPQTSESTTEDDAHPANSEGYENNSEFPVVQEQLHFNQSIGSQQLVSGVENTGSDDSLTPKDSNLSSTQYTNNNDLESAAATKLQSIARRNIVKKRLEKEGEVSSNKSCGAGIANDDLPALSRFCGLGLLFNGAMGGDSKVCVDETQLQIAQEDARRNFMKTPVDNVDVTA